MRRVRGLDALVWALSIGLAGPFLVSAAPAATGAGTTAGPRARVWRLSIGLAGLFRVSAARKVTGVDTIAGQAAAMSDFPAWARMLAAFAEAAGAGRPAFPAAAARRRRRR